jgi:hypothetical protein
VAGSADRTDLSLVSRALRGNPEFLAGWLAATPGGETWLRGRLSLGDDSLHRLLTCRAPVPDRFAADVAALAGYVAVDPTTLAAALREAAVLAALNVGRAAPRRHDAQLGAGLLAAARDTAAEQPPRTAAVSRVRELASATWDAAPAEARQRRDIDAAVVWASPVAVVSLDRLDLASVNRWLADHGAPQVSGNVGDLRGLLIAWRGHAVIFVDGTLPATERRFTLAHEHGHFLLDYLLPRQRVLREAPDLLDILDGRREPTDADLARAALARVPLGLHTHLLHRDDSDGAADSAMAAEDEASTYALEALSPWEELLGLLRGRPPASGSYADRLRAATEAVAEEFVLPRDAAGARAAAGLAALGVRPGFFDR